MKLFALAVLLAAMQTGPQIPRKTPDNAAKGSSDIKSQGAAKKAPPPNSPSSVDRNQSQGSDGDGKKIRGTDPQYSVGVRELPPVSVSKDWADWSVWLFNGLLVVVSFLQVWLLYRTLRAIQRQAALMERQATVMEGQLIAMQSSGKQTETLIEQATKQAAATEGQVRLMERAGSHTEDLAQQAVRQTELTQQELELTHRPWIAVDISPNSPLIFDERGCVMVFSVTMRNVGHSVAKHVSLWTEFAISGVHDPMQVRDKLCNIMKRPENENSDYGWLLFPNQQAIEQRPVIGSVGDVQKAVELKVFQGLSAIGLHLVGCVDYPSSFDPKKHHQTRFVYLLGYVETTRGMVMGAFDPAVKSHLNIVLTPTGHGASAD